MTLHYLGYIARQAWFASKITLLFCCFPEIINSEELPAGVPNPIGPDGRYTHAIQFTTRAYQNEALTLVLKEANQVAKELNLPEQLPITKSNIVKAHISPFGYAYAKQVIGNITTKNYVYYVSKGDKFSYLESPNQDELCRKFQASYSFPRGTMQTNEAMILATQSLAAVSMDVAALDRDCLLKVELDVAYVHPPVGKFVPVYDVVWLNKTNGVRDVASVRVFTPTKTLLQMRVEDPQYILRQRLVFTNLAELLLQTNVLEATNLPASR